MVPVAHEIVMLRTCAFCGHGFTTDDWRRRYCSDICVAGARTRSWQKKYAATLRWRAKNPEKYREIQVRASRRQSLKRRGITPEAYDVTLVAQGGRCAICRTDKPGGRGTWHIDHDHTTGRIRGLLCSGCNLLLGHAHDDVDVLSAAIEYLGSTE